VFKRSIITILIINSSLSACCGCAIVSKSMKVLTKTIKKGMSVGDKMTASLYNNSIEKNNLDSLRETGKRLRELSNTLKIKELEANCNNEMIFELQKANNIQEIIKSLEIYGNSIEN